MHPNVGDNLHKGFDTAILESPQRLEDLNESPAIRHDPGIINSKSKIHNSKFRFPSLYAIYCICTIFSS
jgi:hypothetical protein